MGYLTFQQDGKFRAFGNVDAVAFGRPTGTELRLAGPFTEGWMTVFFADKTHMLQVPVSRLGRVELYQTAADIPDTTALGVWTRSSDNKQHKEE